MAAKFYEYVLTEFWPKWWPLVTFGALFGLEAFLAAYWPAAKRLLDRVPQTTRRNAEYVILVLCVFYAGFAAWSDEYDAKVAATKERDDALGKLAAYSATGQGETISRLGAQLQATQAKLSELEQREAKRREVRHLTDAQKEALTKQLTPIASDYPSLKLCAPGEGEAQGYAKEFAEVFNKAGIKVDHVCFVFPTSPGVQEFTIAVKNLDKVPPKAEQLARALNAAGFDVKGGTNNTLSNEEFEFIIDAKHL
jgi:hypothetical protein